MSNLKRIEYLEHGGKGYSMFTASELREAGVPEAIVAAALEKIKGDEYRTELRARIATAAGDIPSLLGTTADAAALALIGSLQTFVLIAESGTPDMKTALAALPFPMPLAKAKAFLNDIKIKKVRVPALEKGVDAVYAEVAQRSTATANALNPPKA